MVARFAGLARLNRLSGSAEVLWPSLCEFAQKTGRTIRVLDVATGGGDVPARLAEKAVRSGVALDLFGCDKSATAVACAGKNVPAVNSLSTTCYTIVLIRPMMWSHVRYSCITCPSTTLSSCSGE